MSEDKIKNDEAEYAAEVRSRYPIKILLTLYHDRPSIPRYMS